MVRLLFIAVIVNSVLCQDVAYAKDERHIQKGRGRRYVPVHLIKTLINGGGSLITIGQYMETFIDSAAFERRSWQEVDKDLKNFQLELTQCFRSTIDNLKELPYFLAFLEEEKNFRKHLFYIHETFRLTLRTKKQIDEGFLQNHPKAFIKYIKNFVQENNGLIEESIFEIRRMFLDASDTTGFITENVNQARKKYINLCHSNKSELQVLDSLLKSIQVIYLEYYHTKLFLFDLLNMIGPINVASSKATLKNDIEFEYTLILKQFKKEMASASKQFWQCDAPSHETEYYYELQQFSKYLLSTLDNAISMCERNKEPETCYGDGTTITRRVSMCRRTRRCEIGFSNCTALKAPDTSSTIARVCLNKNHKAASRYHGVDLYGSTIKDSECPDGIPVSIPYDGNYYCDCICHEKKYYFSKTFALADYNHRYVVTGARLLVLDDTITIQIQQAQTSGNQTIIGLAEWVTPSKQIKWNNDDEMHTLESVDLTEIKNLSYNEFIVELSFSKSPYTGRMRLVAITNTYNYTTNKLEHDRLRHPKDAIEEHKLDHRDVPTRATEMNKPVSKNNQYVSFTTTSMLKDGGQTTIPFIDTRPVETASPMMPLSGVGLYLRGQPGYGGFIALKLFTYDISSSLDANSDNYNVSLVTDNTANNM